MSLSQEDKDFIQVNINKEISELALKTHRTNSSMGFLLIQIQSRQKAAKKLPSWVGNEDIAFYSKLSTEQCSSEITADYKASFVEGNRLLDLCSGFGVDDVSFSKKVKDIFALELDSDLVKLVRRNHKILACKNIFVDNCAAEEYLSKSKDKFDWIYLDPARRDESNRKLVSFHDCSPNVLGLSLFDFTNNVLLKASPMMDITKAITELANVKEVHVVAVNNEVKELLFVCEKSYKGLIKCICVDLKNNQRLEGDFFEQEVTPSYSEPLKYLFEPNLAIMKAHLFDALMKQFNVKKLHPNTNIFTSEQYDLNFQGRIFEKVMEYPYKPKIIQKIGVSQANVIARNFFITPEVFKKKFKIKDGGLDYLLLCTTKDNKQVVIHCKRIK